MAPAPGVPLLPAVVTLPPGFVSYHLPPLKELFKVLSFKSSLEDPGPSLQPIPNRSGA